MFLENKKHEYIHTIERIIRISRRLACRAEGKGYICKQLYIRSESFTRRGPFAQ